MLLDEVKLGDMQRITHAQTGSYPIELIVFSARKLMAIQGFRFEYRTALSVTGGVLSPRGNPTVRQRL